jgi:hypothetical protein
MYIKLYFYRCGILTNELNIPRRNRKEFTPMSVNFEATLRDEAISSLNKSWYVLISCYMGFGISVILTLVKLYP